MWDYYSDRSVDGGALVDIKTLIFSKEELEENVLFLLENEFMIGRGISKRVYSQNIFQYFDTLKTNIFFLAETKYVDKVYRDTYYKYYSSKFNEPNRYCVRLSLFDGYIDESYFYSEKKRIELKKKYQGFYILRPTCPYVIGRSIVSPNALKNNDFVCCFSEFRSTAKGLSVSVVGFPHSSQDHETMTCAETSLWAIMEYFGNKYPEYNRTLPSSIIDALNEMSIERQLPSKGLDINQLSFALKKFGFGSRIYSKESYGADFESLLSCYVGSGIPLIVSLGNNKLGTDSIEHALLVIGHKMVTPDKIDTIKPYSVSDKEDGPVFKVYDYDCVEKEFVFVDDNCPAYQYALLTDPVRHYKQAWHDCTIDYFIVPLYPRIYLEANEAKKYITRFVLTVSDFLEECFPPRSENELVIRVFLASSRAYKNALVQDDDFEEMPKAYIIESSMPKFIWVAELSTIALIKDSKANGLILLDATEANLEYQKPLILAFLKEKMFKFEKISGRFRVNSLPFRPFSIYRGNFKAQKVKK